MEDYDEVFAPVAQLTTVRVVIVICMHYGIKPRHLDVKTAFLHAKLKHNIYIRLPEGITIGGKTYGKLNKSLYGLKQAAHDWHALQEEFILNHDKRFRRSSVDPCLYVITEGDFVAVISTHVDDYIVATNNDEWYKKFYQAFSTAFSITDLGIMTHILQTSVKWNEDGSVELSQKRFITELAAKHGIDVESVKPMQTPMEPGLTLEHRNEPDLTFPFRSVVCSLLWLIRWTKPEMAYAVIYLSRFLNCYGEEHWKAAKRVVRYAASTADKTLVFPSMPKSANPLTIKAFVDSDWASDPTDRKSWSGSVTLLNNCPVTWLCKKQFTVALSSVEAEYLYMALSDGVREILYVRNLLKEFFKVEQPIHAHVDSKGAAYLAEKNVNNKRSKHIDVRFHFVRQHIAEKVIELFYVPTQENIADIFTKALPPTALKKLSKKLLSN